VKFIVGNFSAQPHCFAYGGFDIQMNRVIDLLNVHNMPSVRVNPWIQKREFSIAHFWGGNNSHNLAYSFCREHGIPSIFSVLLPNPSSSLSLGMRARSLGRRLIKGRQFYARADAVIVINQLQAQVAEQVVGIPKSRIWVIPTIVDEVFFQRSSAPLRDKRGIILCVGTICHRKNQLSLLHTAARLELDVVLCGRYDDAEPIYRDSVQRLIRKNPSRFTQIQDVSPEVLLNLYEQCSVLYCASHHETEPASILEAMICERPVLTANKPYGRNPKFFGAHLCNPNDEYSIGAALIKAIENPVPKYQLFDPHSHSAEYVIDSYRAVYEAVFEGGDSR
jgi:glycosyltransferase involved in cell wall biosynthesis